MNKRKKQWENEVNKGIQIFENTSKETYDYYGKLNRRHHIRSSKGIRHWLNIAIRILLASALLFYQLRGCGIWK
jgi:adenylate kinase family enzyme